MTTISPRVTPETANKLAEMAGNKNAGAAEAITGYLYIRRATLQELKGKFTREEATALLDMYNGTLLTPELQYQPQVLRAKIEDAEQYDHTCSIHGADVNKLLGKTDKLTAAQVWVLQQEIVRAWERNIEGGQTVEELIGALYDVSE